MSINGIIIVDKPAGWTSHDVVAKLRGALKIKRVGHGGTLDPLATGVLPVFIGRATRAAEFCENAEKEYLACLRLGLVTDTQDIMGAILSDRAVSLSSVELSAVIPRFIGAQKQIPPMYSAIKLEGKKLYELARRGIDVPRPPRDIFISTIELLGGNGRDYTIRIVCSKGTYIRTLCHDIGAALGYGGAMSSLCRVRAGAFRIDNAHSINDILTAVSSGNIDKYILPIDSIFSQYPSAKLCDVETRRIKNGAPCRADNLSNGRYRFYGPDNKFLLLGNVVNSSIMPIKSFFDIENT
jgi:tRNA pseudouridine55 synthase